jgi:hypothetical protein
VNRRALEKLDDASLIRLFASTANDLGETVNNWVGAGAKEAKEILNIGDLLRFRGTEARLLLVPLLESKSRYIQYYAALELEGLVPDRCRPIIEANTKQNDAIAGDARAHLRAVDSGFYKPD